MEKVTYSPQALEDLQSIKNYIITNFDDYIAKKVIRKIISDIKCLEEFPLLGVNLAKNIDVPTDYYYIFTEKNYVFYRIETDYVYIIRILNQQQEYMQQLFGISPESDEDCDRYMGN